GDGANDGRGLHERSQGSCVSAPLKYLFMWLLVEAVFAAQASVGRTLVRHDFTASAEGWLISGDTGMSEPIFNATGGHPGGCITGIDEAVGETWYFRAPPALLDQLPAAVNGAIHYSLKQSGDVTSLVDDDIVILGAAGRLSYRFANSPGTDW